MQELSINEARAAIGGPQKMFEQQFYEKTQLNSTDPAQAEIPVEELPVQEQIPILEQRLAQKRKDLDDCTVAQFHAFRAYQEAMQQLFTKLNDLNNG